MFAVSAFSHKHKHFQQQWERWPISAKITDNVCELFQTNHQQNQQVNFWLQWSLQLLEMEISVFCYISLCFKPKLYSFGLTWAFLCLSTVTFFSMIIWLEPSTQADIKKVQIEFTFFKKRDNTLLQKQWYGCPHILSMNLSKAIWASLGDNISLPFACHSSNFFRPSVDYTINRHDIFEPPLFMSWANKISKK